MRTSWKRSQSPVDLGFGMIQSLPGVPHCPLEQSISVVCVTEGNPPKLWCPVDTVKASFIPMCRYLISSPSFAVITQSLSNV